MYVKRKNFLPNENRYTHLSKMCDFYGLILTQEEFHRLLDSDQPFLGLKKAEEVVFDVQQTDRDTPYKFTCSPDVTDKIRQMLEHPLQLLVRVIRHLHEETNEIVFKIFVGVRETWKFDFDSWYDFRLNERAATEIEKKKNQLYLNDVETNSPQCHKETVSSLCRSSNERFK